MLTITSEPPSNEYHFDTKLHAKFSTSDQIKIIIIRGIDRVQGKTKNETIKFLIRKIEKEVLTITSENSSYEDRFETKLQAKFDKYDQSFEQQQEELMNFKERQHQEPK